MRKIIKDAVLKLLHPLSPIVTLIVGWILTVLVTLPNKSFPNFINEMIEHKSAIMTFLILWLIFTVIYSALMDKIEKLNHGIHQAQEIIRQKETQLDHTSGIILNRSGDFADFSRLLRFNDALKGFTENNTIVECVQMYSYSTKRVNNKVVIKVVYDSNYCSDGIDINNLAQCYYDIDYKDYNTIKKVVSLWKKLSSDVFIPLPEKDSMIRMLVDGINDIYRKYNNSLRNIKNISDINSFHFTQYRIMTLLLRLARRQSITMFDKNTILGKDKSDIEDYLLNGKRTGILNSILLEDIFMFKYTRNSHKKDGRAYIAFPINIAMQNYICVFSIQILDLDETIDLEHEIKSLRHDIVKRFEKK